ncbi:MAG: RNA methyltransferase, partial [Negativicutes bacterium]|nr:RNA methyltransferase [Negativicutes bacterium]
MRKSIGDTHVRKLISSVNNELIKETCDLKLKKYRTICDAFIVEGARSTEEIITSGWEVLRVFVDMSADSQRISTILTDLEGMGIPVFEVTSDVMRRLSDTDAPQGILTVVRRKMYELNHFNQGENGLLLVLDEIRDPGNLGTIVRTADAAGVNGIILLEGCADLFSPKAVRATMGSLFH